MKKLLVRMGALIFALVSVATKQASADMRGESHVGFFPSIRLEVIAKDGKPVSGMTFRRSISHVAGIFLPFCGIGVEGTGFCGFAGIGPTVYTLDEKAITDLHGIATFPAEKSEWGNPADWDYEVTPLSLPSPLVLQSGYYIQPSDAAKNGLICSNLKIGEYCDGFVYRNFYGLIGHFNALAVQINGEAVENPYQYPSNIAPNFLLENIDQIKYQLELTTDELHNL